MKTSAALLSFLSLVSPSAVLGLAQEGTISTIVGAQLASGTPAASQTIDGPVAATPDGSSASMWSAEILPAGTRSEAEFAATMSAGLTDDNGAYRFGNVTPGRYYVLAAEDPPVTGIDLPDETLRFVKSPEILSLLQRVRGGGQLVKVGPRAAVQVRVTPKTLN